MARETIGQLWVSLAEKSVASRPSAAKPLLAALVGDEQGRGGGRGTTLLRGWADCISVGNR